MRITRFLIWAGFLLILLVFLYYGRCFAKADVPGILSLELANPTKGRAILSAWDHANLLGLARRLTWIDFMFAISYAAVIIALSNRQIRKEPSIAWNALLRANFLFAVVAGLLDMTENSLLLYDMYQFNADVYISASVVAWLKFILIGWAVFVWLFSFARRRIQSFE